MFDKAMPTDEFIFYIDSQYHWAAARWLEEHQIEFMSFTVDWHMFNKPYDHTGFCFLNENDRLLFSLRWA